MRHIGRWALLAVLLGTGALSATEEKDPLEKTLGPITQTKGDVRFWAIPRTDLNVLVGGTPLEPGMGLDNRFEIIPKEKGLHLKARLVLMDGEIQKILGLLARRHWKVEGLSHWLAGESPSLKVLSFESSGPSFLLADGIQEIWTALSLSPVSPTPVPTASPEGAFQKQADSLLWPGQWKGRVLCLKLEASGNTLEAGAQAVNPQGALYLQETSRGSAGLGGPALPSDLAEKLYPTLVDNQLGAMFLGTGAILRR